MPAPSIDHQCYEQAHNRKKWLDSPWGKHLNEQRSFCEGGIERVYSVDYQHFAVCID